MRKLYGSQKLLFTFNEYLSEAQKHSAHRLLAIQVHLPLLVAALCLTTCNAVLSDSGMTEMLSSLTLTTRYRTSQTHILPVFNKSAVTLHVKIRRQQVNTWLTCQDGFDL